MLSAGPCVKDEGTSALTNIAVLLIRFITERCNDGNSIL
jgi:hypothetical protein